MQSTIISSFSNSHEYRMEINFHGEWIEVGRSNDKNNALLILNHYYGNYIDFRLIDTNSNRVIHYNDHTLSDFEQQYHTIPKFGSNYSNRLNSSEIDGFYQNYLSQIINRNNTMANERYVQVTSRQISRRQLEIYESRISRLRHFNFVSTTPIVSPPQFVGIDANDEEVGNTFNKCGFIQENVNWKEEGF